MKKKYLASLFLLALSLTGCVRETANSNLTSTSSPTASPTVSPTSTVSTETTTAQFTLPVLDAFFVSDENFANDLKSQLSLHDDQIQRLKTVAREETSKLRETESDETGRTLAARELARERVEEIVGKDKAPELYSFLRTRWQGENGSTTPTTEAAAEAVPNSVPRDTRVVVNSPAYRMDVFDQGKLVKSYKIGIGYPEFPLPTGLRKAKAIIFNPTWTPPDEPWVESPSSKVKVGEKVEAGSKLNPLGLLKIPIGSPSLIHGGKSQAKLGKFASHGCVGLTDALAQDFAMLLARIGGTNLSVSDINAFKRNRNETKQVTLDQAVPVELRYETIVAEDGKLHIYRDVYDRNTNTEEHLRAVLEAQRLSLEDLSEEERTQVTEALAEMSRDARGRPDSTSAADEQSSPSPSPAVSPKNKTGKVTRSFKGKQEIVIEIAALKGKGYPAMMNSSVRRS